MINSEGTSDLGWIISGSEPGDVENPHFSKIWLGEAKHWLKDPKDLLIDSEYNILKEELFSEEQRRESVEFYIRKLEKILNYVQEKFPGKEGTVRKNVEELQRNYKDTFGDLP